MRRFLIAFFTVFILATNFFVSGLMVAAESDGVSPTDKAKEILGLDKKDNGINAKDIKEIVFRSEKLADEFYRFRASDMSAAITEIVEKINNGEIVEGNIEGAFPELLELKAKEGGEIVVAGRLWVDDIFRVQSGDKAYYMQSAALKDYFKSIMLTKIPGISINQVIVQKAGQREQIVIGSLELKQFSAEISETVKQVMTDGDREKLAWNQEEIQALLDDPATDYYDVKLTYTLFYHDLEADRIIIFENGKFANKVLFGDQELTKGSIISR